MFPVTGNPDYKKKDGTNSIQSSNFFVGNPVALMFRNGAAMYDYVGSSNV